MEVATITVREPTPPPPQETVELPELSVEPSQPFEEDDEDDDDCIMYVSSDPPLQSAAQAIKGLEENDAPAPDSSLGEDGSAAGSDKHAASSAAGDVKM